MSRIALSNTGDWKLKFEDTQDIRGFKALDKDGTPVGVVDTMIINTERELVDSIVLEDGSEYPARDISIGDGVVYLTTVDAARDVDSEVRVYDDGQIVKRVDVSDADYDAHVDTFRQHHTSTFEGDYADHEPAYRFGYESAYGDAFKNRAYVDAEDDLKTGYATQYVDRDFDADRLAVRYGYSHAQRGLR